MKLSEVLKKDLKVAGYLLAFGLTTYLTDKYLQAGELSIVFGAVANYVLFRIDQELRDQGYKSALGK